MAPTFERVKGDEIEEVGGRVVGGWVEHASTNGNPDEESVTLPAAVFL